jgi:hypothetical protein
LAEARPCACARPTAAVPGRPVKLSVTNSRQKGALHTGEAAEADSISQAHPDGRPEDIFCIQNGKEGNGEQKSKDRASEINLGVTGPVGKGYQSVASGRCPRMSRAARTRIGRHVDESDRCSGSNRPNKSKSSCPPTHLSTVTSVPVVTNLRPMSIVGSGRTPSGFGIRTRAPNSQRHQCNMPTVSPLPPA